MKVLFYSMLLAIGIQDMRTYYISRWWLLVLVPVGIGMLIVYPVPVRESVTGACLYGLPGLLMHHWHRDWIGSADVGFFFYYGYLLGCYRMMVAMCISLFIAFIWLFIKKKRNQSMIPFLTCMSLGVGLSFFKGYAIWYSTILPFFSP